MKSTFLQPVVSKTRYLALLMVSWLSWKVKYLSSYGEGSSIMRKPRGNNPQITRMSWLTYGYKLTAIMLLLCLNVGNVWAADPTATKEWTLTSSSDDFTTSNCTTYFSQPYGMKKKDAYIQAQSISDFTTYAPSASKIVISIKCLQNGGTTSKLTVYLLDKDDKTLGSQEITPTNASSANSTTYQTATFTSNLSKATGFRVTCTTFGKNILINGAKYTITYTAAPATPSTVTLKDDNSTLTELSAGAGVTLPSRTGCEGYTFAGWTKTWVAEQTTWTTDAPDIIPAGSYTPTGDENLYPVYTKTEEGGGGSSEVEFSFGYTDWGKSAQFSGNTYDELSQSKSDITITYTRNSGSTYANTTAMRFYKSNTLKFDAGENTITSIVFSGGIGQSDITTDVVTCTNTSEALSWSGEATSVTFTRPNNAYSYATFTGAKVTISGGSTTSYISVPNCCQNLGQINGSVMVSHNEEKRSKNLTQEKILCQKTKSLLRDYNLI